MSGNRFPALYLGVFEAGYFSGSSHEAGAVILVDSLQESSMYSMGHD
jgi:hypothetical protein